MWQGTFKTLAFAVLFLILLTTLKLREFESGCARNITLC